MGHVMAGLGPAIHDDALEVRRLDLHQETGFDRFVEIGDQVVHRDRAFAVLKNTANASMGGSSHLSSASSLMPDT